MESLHHLDRASAPWAAPQGDRLSAAEPDRLALSQAWVALLGGSPAQQELALAALVEGTDGRIDRDQDAHGPDWAAQQRAQLHVLLLRLVRTLPVGGPLQKAARWHSRLSHEALMAHVQEHGGSAVIDEALRAGCLLLQMPGSGAPGLAH